MAKYNYVLSDDKGVKETGVIRAPSLEEAKAKLSEEGKILISLTQEKNSLFSALNKPALSLSDKLLFIRNLGTMIKVGVTITEALELIIEQSSKKPQKRMYGDILEMVKSGQTLANSLNRYDYVFSKLFINMIATGEESGNLEKTLEYLATQLEKEAQVKGKVISALIYPAVITALTVIISIGIVIFVMPKITEIFDTFDMDLPLPTQILVNASNFFTNYPLLSLGIGVAIIAFFIWIFRAKFMKPIWDRVFVRIPLMGQIIKYANIARINRTLSSLLEASLSVTKSLNIISDMLDNLLYKQAIADVSKKVEKGGSIGAALEFYQNLFPILAVKMIAIGERTGSLNSTSVKIAEMYEELVDTRTKRLSVLLEPLLLVGMGALVGGIALSIIVPIYKLPQALNT